ncbi:MAG: MerC domain-containing protein [Pseudomonadota bacterium]
MTNEQKTQLLDRTAIGLSALCIVHCLALPLLIVLLPSLAALPFADERFHLLLVFLVVPTSAIALFMGCRRHRDRSVLAWGLTGVVILLLTALYGHDLVGEVGERAFTVLGAVMVAIGHIRNFRLCRSDACAH